MIRTIRYTIPLIIVSGIVFLLPFFVYLMTLCPTVYVGDSGELTTSAYVLGISHPPGYPLYSIFGKIFTIILPISNIAYRINLMSAVFASLTVLLLYLLIIRLVVSAERLANTEYHIPHTVYFIAFSVSLCFAFSKIFWNCSIASEVYTLNIFFVIITLYVLISKLFLFQQDKFLYVFACLSAFGAAHHPSFAIIIPVYLLFLPYRKYKANAVFISFMFFILGLSVYLYLPIRSLAKPPINWGNPDNLLSFIDHVARKQYGDIGSSSYSITRFIQQMKFISGLLIEQHTFIIWLFSVPGIILLWNKNKKILFLTIFLFAIFVLGLPLIINFPINPLSLYLSEIFFLPAFLILTVWIGFGIAAFKESLCRISNILGRSATYIVLIFIVINPFISHYSKSNASADCTAYNFAKSVLLTLENKDDSVFFVEGDNLVFPLAYLQKVELSGINNTIYDETGNIFKNIYGNKFLKLSKQEYEKKKDEVQREILNNHMYVYFFFGTHFANADNLRSYPNGLMFGVNKNNISYQDSAVLWKSYPVKYYDKDDFKKDYMSRDLLGIYHIFLGEYFYFSGRKDKILKEYGIAGSMAYDNEPVNTNIANQLLKKELSEESLGYYEKVAFKIAPLLASSHYNLGYILEKLNKLDLAERQFKETISLDPKYSNAYGSLGILYSRINLPKQAIQELRNAVKIDPYNTKARFNLGVLYANISMFDDAIKEWEFVLKIDPNYIKAKENIEKVTAILNRRKL